MAGVSCLVAASAHAANRQPCSASQLAALGKAAHAAHFASRDQDPDGVLRDAACKPAPGAPGTTLAVVAWGDGPDNAVPGLLAVLDDASGRVLASLREDFVQDPLTDIRDDVLHLDTAPYLLAPGVRAFGVDIEHHDGPRYADGGVDRSRALYVREGAAVRRVLDEIDMSTWTYVSDSVPAAASSPEEADRAVQHFKITIAIGPQVSHGWHDLVLTATSCCEAGHDFPPLHVRLPYDGRGYPLKAFEDAYWRWRK